MSSGSRSLASAPATPPPRTTRRTKTSRSTITSTTSAPSVASFTYSPAARSREVSGRERRVLLGVLGALTFASVYATVVIAPVLTQIAAEFDISTGTAGLLVAAYAAPGVIVSLITGPFSDRLGRRRFLIAGSAGLGGFPLPAAFATTFPVLLALRLVGGVGAAL